MPSHIDEAGHANAFDYPVVEHWGEIRNVQFRRWDSNRQHIGPESNVLPTEPPRQWRIQGGGPGGPDPPLLGHNVGFLTLGPKVGPPPFANVQEWGCFSIFLMADDVTQTMSKGGVLVECPRVGVFFKFFEVG